MKLPSVSAVTPQRYRIDEIFLPWIFLCYWILKTLTFCHFSKKKRKKENIAVVYSLCLWNSLLPSLTPPFIALSQEGLGNYICMFYYSVNGMRVPANTFFLVEFPHNRQPVLNKQPGDKETTQKLSAGGCRPSSSQLTAWLSLSSANIYSLPAMPQRIYKAILVPCDKVNPIYHPF